MIARTPTPRRTSAWAPWVSTAARWILGGVLVVAGGLKVIDPIGSVQAVRAYEIVPPGLDTLVGWGLPFAEIVLGLLLITGTFTRVAAGVSAALLVAFIAGVISAWARGLSIDCGCFGGGGQVEPGQTAYGREIIRDLGLLALAGWLIVRPRSRWALDRDPVTDDADWLEVAR